MGNEKASLITSSQTAQGNNNDNKEETTSTNINKTPKKSFKETLLSWLPTWLQFRKDLKASIAILIGVVFAFANHTREISGGAVILVPIVMIFYFPVRPYGIQTENCRVTCLHLPLLGTTGAVISALYSLLGTYLANLARDHSKSNPIQPGVCAVLGVFLFFGVFILNYIRMNYLKANFAVVNGCILICFTFTYGAVLPGFHTELTWLFLRPIALAAALSLAVNYFLWPDDSVTNYMAVLNKVLADGELFFKENSEAFLEMKTNMGVASLSVLRGKLQGGILLLIDCKRAVQREIIFTKLSPTDITALTRILKSMYPTLHGLGLSNILEKDYLSKHIQDPLLRNAMNEDKNKKYNNNTSRGEDNDDDDDDNIDDYNIITGFEDSVNLMKATCRHLTQSTAECIQECRNGLSGFQKKPRTILNSILWPFPRIYCFSRNQDVDIESARHRLDQAIDTLTQTLQQFDQVQQSNQIQRYTQICQKWKRQSMMHSNESLMMTSDPDDYTYGPLYLIFLYQTSLREYCSQVLELAHFIQQLQNERTRRKIYFPKKSLKKWFRSASAHEAANYTTTNSNRNSQLASVIGHESTHLTLVRTSTRPDLVTENDIQNGFVTSKPNHYGDDHNDLNNNNNNNNNDDDDDPNHKKKKNKIDHSKLYLDPDVLPPSTFMEHFFDKFYKIYLWLSDFNTVFALKTAIGVVLFSIPAWRPESASWYNEWKGQWCLITICLWLFPTSGLYLFGIYTRVLGSIVGGILGGVIWEIARGNVYAVTVLCFILFFPFYHVFFYNHMYRVAALLGKITMLLVVIYGYNAALEGETDINSIWFIVAHRLLAIVIGILAAGLLIMFPKPVQGRIELRKRLAITIRDIGRLYGIISAEVAFADNGEPTHRQIKHFRKIVLDIRRQIADERNLLAHAKYEPPLRGKFPAESYTKLLNIADNMADLVQGMGHNVRRIRPQWRKQIANSLMKERREYLANIMTTLKLISTTLAAKTPLPPFLLQPKEAMDRFAKILENEITLRVHDMEDPSFTSYSAYMMNASSFVRELNDLLEATTTLVGVDAPDLWLKVHQ